MDDIFLTPMAISDNLTVITTSDCEILIVGKHGTLTKKMLESVDIAQKIAKHPNDELKMFTQKQALIDRHDFEKVANFSIAVEYLIHKLKLERLYIKNSLLEEITFYCGERYYAIEGIINLSFDHIKKHIPKCPKTPKELFLMVVDEELNYPFEQYIVKEFVEFNRPEYIERINKILNKETVETLDSGKLLTLIFNIINQTKIKDKRKIRNLKYYFDVFKSAHENFLHFSLELWEQRTKAGFVVDSFRFNGTEFENVQYNKPKNQ